MLTTLNSSVYVKLYYRIRIVSIVHCALMALVKI